MYAYGFNGVTLSYLGKASSSRSKNFFGSYRIMRLCIHVVDWQKKFGSFLTHFWDMNFPNYGPWKKGKIEKKSCWPYTWSRKKTILTRILGILYAPLMQQNFFQEFWKFENYGQKTDHFWQTLKIHIFFCFGLNLMLMHTQILPMGKNFNLKKKVSDRHRWQRWASSKFAS